MKEKTFKIANNASESGFTEMSYIEKINVIGEEWVIHLKSIGMFHDNHLFVEELMISHYRTGYGLPRKIGSELECIKDKNEIINKFTAILESKPAEKIAEFKKMIERIPTLNE